MNEELITARRVRQPYNQYKLSDMNINEQKNVEGIYRNIQMSVNLFNRKNKEGKKIIALRIKGGACLIRVK